jgi:hypothetical protein
VWEPSLERSCEGILVKHPELLTAIYDGFHLLKQKWDEGVSMEDNIGVLVFKLGILPDRECACSLDPEFWPLHQAQAYLKNGKQSDEGLIELLFDFDFEQEFLAMIIEYDDDTRRHVVYVHKISRMGLN